MSETKLEGGCQCGAVRYQSRGRTGYDRNLPLLHVQTGQCPPAVAWAMYQEPQVSFTGARPKLYASSEEAQRGFCGACGTQLSFTAAYIPGLIDLTIGSLDHPDAITPQFHYWHSKHLAWAEFADALPRHAEFPPLG